MPHIALGISRPVCYLGVKGGSSSVVECFLAKEDVAGSTPVSRSKRPLLTAEPRPRSCAPVFASVTGLGARYPSGKGEVCKTFMRRFDPGPRLHTSSSIRRTPSFSFPSAAFPTRLGASPLHARI